MGLPGFTVGTKFTSCSSPFSHAKTPYVHIVLAVHDRYNIQHTTFTQGSHTMVSLGLRLSEARTVTFPEFAALIEKAVAVAARPSIRLECFHGVICSSQRPAPAAHGARQCDRCLAAS